MLRQIESRYVSDILYHKWFPQIFMDMHHMGNSDARLLLSPLSEPRHHSLDPLMTREIELTGAYMRTLLEERSMAGVIHSAYWNHWRMSAFHTCALWHNVTTILFEAAGTPLATPIFQESADLTGAGSQTINYPNPWRGGWWRLGDIVEYSYWSCFGFLEAGASFREKYLLNMYRKARNSINNGATTAPYAYIIPNDQKDPNRAVRMINILIDNGVEVHQAKSDFSTKGRTFPAGTPIILMAQAYRPFITDILGPQHYPDHRKYPDGPPERAFDLTGWTLPYQMDVVAIKSDSAFEVPLEQTQKAEYTPGRVFGSDHTFILDHKVLDSYRAVNRLLDNGAKVSWATRSFDTKGKSFPQGSIIVSTAGTDINMETIGNEYHLQIETGVTPRDLLELFLAAMTAADAGQRYFTARSLIWQINMVLNPSPRLMPTTYSLPREPNPKNCLWHRSTRWNNKPSLSRKAMPKKSKPMSSSWAEARLPRTSGTLTNRLCSVRIWIAPPSRSLFTTRKH